MAAAATLRTGFGAASQPVFDGYTVLQLVGTGAFGRVYHAVAIDGNGAVPDGDHVAIKTVAFDALPDDMGAVLAEVSNMALTQHTNVLAFHDCFLPPNDNTLAVVIEWVDGGSLAEVLELTGRATPEAIKCVALDALRGLEHLHSDCHVVHRDVKSGNLLLTRDGVVKLGDFGASGVVTGTRGGRNTTIGTPGWMAPEVAARLRDDNVARSLSVGFDGSSSALVGDDDTGYRYEADIWSLGTTLIELALGEAPAADTVAAVKAAADNAAVGGDRSASFVTIRGHRIPTDLLCFVARMLEPDPARRPTAKALLQDAALAPLVADDAAVRATLRQVAVRLPHSRCSSPRKGLRPAHSRSTMASENDSDATPPPSRRPSRKSREASDDDNADGSDSDRSLATPRSARSLDDTIRALDQTAQARSSTSTPLIARRRSGSRAESPFTGRTPERSANTSPRFTIATQPDLDDDQHKPYKTLTTTAWHMVNPAVASLLRGRDVALGAAIPADAAPSVYQRTRAAAGLRAAQRRDAAAAAASQGGSDDAAFRGGSGAVPYSAPFGPMYTHVLLPALHGTTQRGVLRDGAKPPDAATHKFHIETLAAKLAACEAAVPSFSSRFVTAVLEGAAMLPAMAPTLMHISERGTELTTHRDGTVQAVAMQPTMPSHAGRSTQSFGSGATTPAGIGPFGNNPLQPLGLPTQQAQSNRTQLSMSVSTDLQRPPRAPPAMPPPLGDVALVVTAPGDGANGAPRVDPVALLFDRWRKDVAAERVRSN